MLPALLIDDTPANILILRQLLAGYCPQVQVIGQATNIEEGYRAICTLQPALVFLDIEMPGGGGFDLLRKFSAINFEVIFVTAYNHYAVQAFREHALAYLLKPIDIEALQQAVARAEKLISLQQTHEQLAKYLQQLQPPAKANTKVSLPVQDGYLFLDSSDIIRCQGSGSYSWLYLKSGKKLMISMRLKECGDVLPSDHFFRVHNSHIININYVSRYVKGRGGYVVLQDETAVEVAVSRKDEFLELIRNLK
jgi:two-component system LytT family response regulator